MAKNVIVKMRKINCISGNIRYLADTKDHPDLCYVYGTCLDKKIWNEYARMNQKEFLASGASAKEGNRCIEAREAIYIFPQAYYSLSKAELERIAQEIVDEFAKTHGVDVYAALHGNDKECNNMHLHIMYMERTREVRDAKIATRRLYFDDKGRQVKSKKYAVDEAGNLLPGYSFVKTGETYGGTRTWSVKNQYLRSNQFTRATKIWWANWLNKQRNLTQEPEIQESDKREVYNPETSPYLPIQAEIKPFRYSDEEKYQESRKKAQELSRDIIECNELRIEYNDLVDQAKENGVNLDELIDCRKGITAGIIEALEAGEPGKIKEIIKNGIQWIQKMLEKMLEMAQKKAESGKKPSITELINSGTTRTGVKKPRNPMQRKPTHDSR